MEQSKPGMASPSGPSTIIVEKHKSNFMQLHGTFSNKPSENIERWIEKADSYRTNHMIPSLEMACIITHCIKGEPSIKVKRMQDVESETYVHADHYCQQDKQDEQKYEPYREHKKAEHNNGVEVMARPVIEPRRAEPEVKEDQCLKAYLLNLYRKTVNLQEAEKYLSTFRTQKQKQTCSNFIDEFIIHFANYTHMRWDKKDRETGKANIEKERMSLLTDGLCKEFKIYCDNIEFKLKDTTLKKLEEKVDSWQKDTTTGMTFTAACNPAKPGNIGTSSATDLNEYFTASLEIANQEAQTSATQPSANTSRGQRGGRGQRGITRGARGRGGRGRGANSNGPRAPQISRDVLDGNHPNYRQTQDGQLYKSIHGHPLCNYCGGPSHKRQNCSLKATDREAGLTRIYHPDRDKMVANQEKARSSATTAMFKDYPSPAIMAMNQFPMAQPMPQFNPLQYMPPPPITSIPTPQWQMQTNQTPTPPKMEAITNQQEMIASAFNPKVCPYSTCQTILSDHNQAQEHMQKFHSSTNQLALGPGARP